MSSESEARVLDGRTWSDFCRALERAGDVILRDASPHDPFERAEGFRYLSRLTRVALESFNIARVRQVQVDRPAGGHASVFVPFVAQDILLRQDNVAQ